MYLPYFPYSVPWVEFSLLILGLTGWGGGGGGGVGGGGGGGGIRGGRVAVSCFSLKLLIDTELYIYSPSIKVLMCIIINNYVR